MRLWDACDATQIAGPMLTLLDPVIILVAVPILETCVYPRFPGGRPALMTRFSCGIACSFAAVVYTAAFEIHRRSLPFVTCPASDSGACAGSLKKSQSMTWRMMTT